MNGAGSSLPPPAWRPLARLVLFLLGVSVIIDALFGASPHIGQLIVGLLLVGLLPVDELLSAFAQRMTHRDKDAD